MKSPLFILYSGACATVVCFCLVCEIDEILTSPDTLEEVTFSWENRFSPNFSLLRISLQIASDGFEFVNSCDVGPFLYQFYVINTGYFTVTILPRQIYIFLNSCNVSLLSEFGHISVQVLIKAENGNSLKLHRTQI